MGVDVIRAGAAGYLPTDAPRTGLIKATEGTVNGQTFVDPGVAGKLFTLIAGKTIVHDTTVAADLSPRERDALKFVARPEQWRDRRKTIPVRRNSAQLRQLDSCQTRGDRSNAGRQSSRRGMGWRANSAAPHKGLLLGTTQEPSRDRDGFFDGVL